ncbi:general odorant-binding protein 56d-like [Uranotaenia lowii]|uniref:general odorant-binding protein 56d-like n=1 Tax=Uranotaenia lowii TaxID=190385 RepID=UPI002479C8A1|nr:general odorant-binding protein 56d-like [Uranotaenia lowii]
MKYLLVLSVLAVGAHGFFTPEQLEIAKKFTADCSQQLGAAELPDNIGERFRDGDLTLTDPKSKCFMRCVFAKAGFLNEEGTIDRDTLVAKLAKGNGAEKAAMFGEKCHMFEGADGCEKAHGLFECYWKNKAEIFGA